MDVVVQAVPQLASGLTITAFISIGAAIVAIGAAFSAGLARLSRLRAVRWLATAYIEFFRGTSALVQLYWAFYALPMIGIVLPATVVGIGGLGLCIGAYGAEVVRAAIGAIGQGQFDAAAALGLSPLKRMTLVILPQALRMILPQFGNLAIELMKGTALVSLITLHDLTFEAQMVNVTTLRTAEIFAAILVIYYILARCITFGFRALENYINRGTSVI